VIGGTHRQTGDLIGLLSFFESRLRKQGLDRHLGLSFIRNDDIPHFEEKILNSDKV
jgi:hypothetical protein